MNIAIFGSTGFIGIHLTPFLEKEGHHVTLFTRTPTKKNHRIWNPTQLDGWQKMLEDQDVIVNLCGSSIAEKRWSSQQKQRLFSSRIQPTQMLVNAISLSKNPPKVFINASAIGIYPDTTKFNNHPNIESSPPGTHFLSQLCIAWENATQSTPSPARVILLRTGIVLGKGGFLSKVSPPFKLGLGILFGNGNAPFPWIHIEDLCRLIHFSLTHPTLSGPLNCVAPEKITHKFFFKTLAKTLKKPLLLKIPSLLVKLMLGEMSDLLLKGHDAEPQKALRHGFIFKYPTLQSALD